MPKRKHLDWKEVWSEHTRRRYTEHDFVSTLGATIAVVTAIWAALPEDSIRAAHLDPVHLLWLLHWLRKYHDWNEHTHLWNVCEKTFRTHVKDMLYLVHAHLSCIHMVGRAHDIFDYRVFLVIDATVCPIQTNRKNWAHQAPYYSGRHKMHCLKYEMAVHWLTGTIHWIAGGVFGSMSDITVTRCSGFLDALLQGEWVLADKGYEGERQILTPFKGLWTQLPPMKLLWNKLMNPSRTIVENAFARLHKFKILSTPFRGPHSEHPVIFRVIANIAQLDIELHPLRQDGLLDRPDRHHFYTDDQSECDPVGLKEVMQFGLLGH